MLTMIAPHSIESEQSILGAMMQDFGAWEAAQPLKAAHFFDQRHGHIYLAISKLISQDKDAEPLAVSIELGEHLNDCGGLDYLNALRLCVVGSKNTAHYAKLIRDKATERGILDAAASVPAIVAQNTTSDEKLDAALRNFETLAQNNVRKMPRSIYEITLEQTEFYEALQKKEIKAGYPTHIPALDRKLAGGFREGDVIVIAARPSVGKSSFSEQIGLTLAQQNLVTLFLSMEMTERQVTDRGVSNLGRVDFGRLKSGEFEKDDWARITEAIEKMGKLPFYIDDQAGLTITDIKTKVRATKGVKVVIVDYIQLMPGDKANRNLELEEISRGLKQIAKDHNAIVIVLSQLNRQVENRAGSKKPNMSDLRDSGAIEQDADVIIFLWPVKDYGEGRKLIGCSVAKNREGETGDFALQFDGKFQQWAESTDSIEPYEPKTKFGGFK